MMPAAIRSELMALAPESELLAEGSQITWWRTNFGIIGFAELSREAGAGDLVDLTNAGYALLDFLPEERLPVYALWNLTLVYVVPWTYEEASKNGTLCAKLEASRHDTRGARKVLLWLGERLSQHFGRLTTASGAVRGISWDDPLRHAIDSFSRDGDERTSLEVLFKRKLTEDDIDDLVRVLGRRAQP